MVFLGALSCLFTAWCWPWVFCFLLITFASSYQHLHVARYHIKVTLLNQLSDNLQTWSIKRKRGQMPIRRDSPCDFYIVILMFDWISSRRNCKYLYAETFPKLTSWNILQNKGHKSYVGLSDMATNRDAVPSKFSVYSRVKFVSRLSFLLTGVGQTPLSLTGTLLVTSTPTQLDMENKV